MGFGVKKISLFKIMEDFSADYFNVFDYSMELV